MTERVTIEGLVRTRGRERVLDGVDLALRADELCVLLGASGAGKSTLLRAVIGLEPVRAARLEVLGLDPRRAPDAVRRKVGWVPDHSDVTFWMTPADCARFHAHRYEGWDAAHLARLFERLGVPVRRRFSALSRGEAAKALLALALASRPRLLLLDEPLARLDPRTKDEVLACLLEHVPVPGGACLLATHDLDVAARAADRVVALSGGRIDTVLRPTDLEHVQGEPGGLRAALERTYDRSPVETSL